MKRRVPREQAATRIARPKRRVAPRRLMSALSLIAFAVVGVGAGYLGVHVRRALQSGEIFAVEEISVEGNRLVPVEEVRAYAGLTIGQGLYSFEAAQVEREISAHPLVRRARLIRRPPRQLRILITEERPVLYVALGSLYAVSAGGEVFARAEALGGLELPVITGVEADLLGDGERPASRELSTALQVLKAYTRAGHRAEELAEIHVDKARGVDLRLTGEARWVHLGEGRYVEKLARLAILRAWLQRHGRRAEQVFLSDGPDPRRVVVRLDEPAPAAGGTEERGAGTPPPPASGTHAET